MTSSNSCSATAGSCSSFISWSFASWRPKTTFLFLQFGFPFSNFWWLLFPEFSTSRAPSKNIITSAVRRNRQKRRVWKRWTNQKDAQNWFWRFAPKRFRLLFWCWRSLSLCCRLLFLPVFQQIIIQMHGKDILRNFGLFSTFWEFLTFAEFLTFFLISEILRYFESFRLFDIWSIFWYF